MIVDIRGALGGQIVSLLIGVSRLASQGQKEKPRVRINIGGFEGTHIGVDYIKRVFPGLSTEMVDDRRKVRFSDPSIWSLVEGYREHWTKLLRPVPPPPRVPGLRVLHVRTGDRSPNALATYKQFLGSAAEDIVLVGNDPKVLKKLSVKGNRWVSSKDPVEDWSFVRRAEHVFGTRSYFTMSAAILDPNLNVTFFRKQDGSVRFMPWPVKVFDSASERFRNVSFLEELS